MKKPTSQAISKYKAFHGKTPSKLTKKNISMPNTLVELASPEFITYFSDKKNGGGNGTKTGFKHKFAKSTKLYCSPDGRMLVLMGPKVKVNNRGIIG